MYRIQGQPAVRYLSEAYKSNLNLTFISGELTHRSINDGSYFIKQISGKIPEESHNTHLDRIVKTVGI